ncbi:FAD-binding protein [uncultured Mailhella sp.]|uniref:FAD-dependent oxidoreductase n=1 Tax=uncultured Mailhella sp. TaxID=1981031 RepID=UPI0025D56C3E|nr:FAD-binding protein [uncultured Mailhella sp.]
MKLTPWILNADVLIVGGGFAGMWAAKKAREHVEDVLVIDKGPRDWGGLGSMCGGDMIARLPGDDIDAMLRELVYYYDGLVEQDFMEEILRQSTDRFRDYEALGHHFRRDDEGHLIPVPQRGLANMKSYLSVPLGSGGANLRRELLGEMDRLNVRRMGNIYVTDLLVEDGRAVGAAGFHTLSGRPVVCRARAVVLAANMGGWKTSYHMSSCAGDGVPLAFNAGLPLRNFEFIRVWNTPKLFAWEGQTNLLPHGARFVNRLGEDFMSRYAPTLGAKGDPHYNVRGMAHEVAAGRGPIYFDTSRMPKESVSALRPKAGWAKLHDTKLLEIGIDFFGRPQEWMPQVLTSYGGVMCGKDCSTPVEGLYSAGRSCGIDGGVYMGGLSMCLVATTGYIAGENAGRFALEHEERPLDKADVRQKLDAALAPLGREGLAPKDAVRRIQEIISSCDVCILKTAQGLKKGLEKLRVLQQEVLPSLGAPDPHYLMKAREAEAMAMLTEFTLNASLMREESRDGHFRADFPHRDNEHWLCWIVIRNKDGQAEYTTRKVPLERYKVQPERYYMDNFHFPTGNN